MAENGSTTPLLETPQTGLWLILLNVNKAGHLTESQKEKMERDDSQEEQRQQRLLQARASLLGGVALLATLLATGASIVTVPYYLLLFIGSGIPLALVFSLAKISKAIFEIDCNLAARAVRFGKESLCSSVPYKFVVGVIEEQRKKEEAEKSKENNQQKVEPVNKEKEKKKEKKKFHIWTMISSKGSWQILAGGILIVFMLYALKSMRADFTGFFIIKDHLEGDLVNFLECIPFFAFWASAFYVVFFDFPETRGEVKLNPNSILVRDGKEVCRLNYPLEKFNGNERIEITNENDLEKYAKVYDLTLNRNYRTAA
jgi:hypothetical protein